MEESISHPIGTKLKPPSEEANQKRVTALKEVNQKRYIVTSPTGEETEILGLSAFCRGHDLDPSSMTKAALGKIRMVKGWKCRIGWELENGEKPPEFKPPTDYELSAIRSKAQAQKWVVVKPDGEELEITNLTAFCRENNLNSGNMVQVAKGTVKQCKGWKCRKAS
jgi:hypothetical protein